MKNLRIAFVLILLVGLMGLLTACGGNNPTATVAVTAPTATTGTTAAEPTATTASAAEPTATTASAAEPTATTAMAADTPTTGTGSGTGTGDNTVLQAATDAMKGVTSYHFTMTTDMGTTGTSTAEGDMIPPDKMSMTTSANMAGQTVETKLIKIGTDTWTYVGGQWIKSQTPMTVNPSDLMSMGNVADVQDLGDATIDGIATKHFSYKSSADATGTTTNSMSEIWLDKATNRVVQVVSTTDVAGTGTVKVTMKFSRYNDPSIKIEPPQ